MGRRFRRAMSVCGGTLVAALACALVGAGAVDGAAGGHPSLFDIFLVASILVLVIAVVARRLQFQPPTARAQRVSFWLSLAPALADVETATSMVLGSFALIAATGGVESPLYPVLYGVVAFAVTFQGRAGAWAAIVAAFGIEAAFQVRAMPVSSAELLTAGLHVAFLAAAAAAHLLFLRGLARRKRRRHDRALKTALHDQRDAARDYRLIASALDANSRAAFDRREEEYLLGIGGHQLVSAHVYHMLGLLKRTLGARTCVLLWVDEASKDLKVKERVTDSDEVTEAATIQPSGVIGAIVRDHTAMTIGVTKPGQVAYVDRSESVGAFAGVPVLEGLHLRGVLCADRAEPFEGDALELLAEAAEQVLRFVQAELVFRSVERSRYEHERFFNASALLCEALTIEQVLDTAFAAASQIVDHDVAAVSIFDRDRNRHRVYSVRVHESGTGMVDEQKLSGLEFRPNSGLVAMVVKNKHYLPAGGEIRDPSAAIYTKRIKLKDAQSLLVLPLLSADEAIGTFLLASRRPRRFGKDVREMLRVIANQVAVSMQNAMMYRKMETMATTDGLTGLTNHRSFQERFGDLLARSARHGHQAAMLLCDVDHFKNVNDTYGHPVGDEVLRRVAAVLRKATRKIDIPARYGGEEFAVVLEATDLDGALRLAERIREDVGALVLDSDQGTFQITMSVGVASFPDDSRDRAALIERADMALYHAKETGRNRVVSYQAFDEARKRRAS